MRYILLLVLGLSAAALPAEDRLFINVAPNGQVMCSGPNSNVATHLSGFVPVPERTVEATQIDPTTVGTLPCDHEIWSGPTKPATTIELRNEAAGTRDVSVMLTPTAPSGGQFRPLIQRLSPGGILRIKDVLPGRTLQIDVAPPGGKLSSSFRIGTSAKGATGQAGLACAQGTCSLDVK